ncbi:ornithine decarboxylase [Dermacentor silvarum]|uniref:ornithine decarboxylase n=1 Tax=Dermacentor silvarum TaxID=543639 RepID=UPI002101765D|nr:ornithine decarboxylase [Dermacentor silvarum]
MSNTSYTNIYVDDSVINVARDVIQQQVTGDAFFVCDVRDLEYKVNLWRSEMPNVTPFFAVKCCTDLVVLRTLSSLGVNFDCSNKVEIEIVMQLGVSPERIVFANPIKSVEDLDYAKRNNVTLMTFDSTDELDKIRDKNARLLLRIQGNTVGCGITMNNKFGCSLADASKVLRKARCRNLNIAGVSFHIGAAFKHPTVFQRTIEDAKAVFDVGRELGFKMDTLDIGGGFPGGARKLESFVELCCIIRDAIDTNFPPSSCVNIIAEPGQFFVTSAYTLITKVVGIRKNVMTIEGKFCEHRDVFINESKCNTINRDLSELMDIHISPLEPPVNRPRDILTTIWGATCHPWDMIVDRSHFFAVADGEWLVFDNMGAYTLVSASGFNGFGFPRVHYIASAACLPLVEFAVIATRARSGYGHLERVLEPRPLEVSSSPCTYPEYSFNPR